MAKAKTVNKILISQLEKNSKKEPKGVVLTDVDMTRVYNMYFYHFVREDAIGFLQTYMKKRNLVELASILPKIKYKVFLVAGWIARMLDNGCTLPETSLEYLNSHIEELKNIIPVETTETQDKPEKIKNYENRAILLVEDVIDKRLKGDRNIVNFRELFANANLSANEYRAVINYYEPILEEVLNKTKDPQIREAYNKYSKVELKDIQNFYNNVISVCNAQISIKKISRKPRVKKETPVSKQISHIRVQQHSSELNIASQPPEKILDSSMVALYNTKYNTLSILVAKPDEKLKIHRTQITNFDPTKSITKKIRKPKEFVPLFLGAAKLSGRKLVDSLSTKASQVTSFYTNENVIILKTFA